MKVTKLFRTPFALIAMAVLAISGFSQTRSKATSHGNAVLWKNVNVRAQDTYNGPGGREMQPDLSRIVFLKEEKGGYSKKFRIRDGSGRTWVAKVGLEAQSETASVRLLSAIGYLTEINYLVPRMTIPGKGTFTNVRLEARPEGFDRGKEWRWGLTPFEDTREMRGLMLMMAFLNNWDMKSANNVLIDTGSETQYVISDLGVSFGKTGSNGWPLFWRFGRSRNNPGDYARARFVQGVKDNRVRVQFNGKNRSRMKSFTVDDARWLSDRLSQLSDLQIRDAFRAANYSPREIDVLAGAVKSRILQLRDAGRGSRLAARQ
jgi:hypothetical protein